MIDPADADPAVVLPEHSHPGDAKQSRRTPWRDNLEAMAMAIIMAMLLKGFLIEAYKIPTGSMQPTLIGDDAMDVHDRILVDKLSFAFRDPRRFEVVVFKYPLDRSKAFVKRIVGVGPEEFRVHHGDLWNRADAEDDWHILRRPRGAQKSAWRNVEPFLSDRPAWSVEEGGLDWRISTRSIQASGPGTVRWRPELGTVRDRYWDGYDPSLLALLERRRERGGLHSVGDLRLEASVTGQDGTDKVILELEENDMTFRLVLPGPAAAPGERVRIEVQVAPSHFGQVPAGVSLDSAWRLPAGKRVRVALQNMDDLVELQLEGKWTLALEVPAVPTVRAGARLAVTGKGARLDELRLLRDTYYTSSNSRANTWSIPSGHYFALGDNTQDSSDSREWTFERYELSGEAEEKETGLTAATGSPAVTPKLLRANARRGENPITYGFGLADGPRLLIRDEWGERYDVRARAARRLSPEDAPFVPRELILGRALATFWPLDPRRGLWRLGWIR